MKSISAEELMKIPAVRAWLGPVPDWEIKQMLDCFSFRGAEVQANEVVTTDGQAALYLPNEGDSPAAGFGYQAVDAQGNPLSKAGIHRTRTLQMEPLLQLTASPASFHVGEASGIVLFFGPKVLQGSCFAMGCAGTHLRIRRKLEDALLSGPDLSD